MAHTTENISHTDNPEKNGMRAAERFKAELTKLAERIPEINARPEIGEAGIQLIDEYGLKPSLFEDEGRSLVFAAIASREADRSDSSDDQAHTEKMYLSDAIALLASDHSDKLIDAKRLIDAEDTQFDETTRFRVYEKYTDVRLSHGISEAIRSRGLLDAVRSRLGVTDENEDPFQIRVLSIGSVFQSRGLDAPAINYDDIDYTSPDDRALVDKAHEERNAVQGWKDGLEQRATEFRKELGIPQYSSDAWVTEINGEKNLCISMPLAEKLLDESLTSGSQNYSVRDREMDISILEHEYTHTQGGVNLDGKAVFGINLEELRAEYFSGNNLGYQDIKGLFRDYEVVTGQSVALEMSKLEKGGTPAEVYSRVANTVGLSETLSILLASPDNYVDEQSNTFTKAVHEHIGGIDGVLGSVLDAQLGAGAKDAIEKRVDITAKRLNEIVNRPGSPIDLDFVENTRKRAGSHAVTELIVERARELQRANAESTIN